MSDADRFWENIVGSLRAARGVAGLTPHQAKRAFDEAGESHLSEAEIDGIVDEVVSGQLSVWDIPPKGSWIQSVDSELQDSLLSSHGLVEEKDETDVDDGEAETENLTGGLDNDGESRLRDESSD